MMRFVVAFLVFLASAFVVSPVRASSNPSFDAAMAACQSYNDPHAKEHFSPDPEQFDHCGLKAGDNVRVWFFIKCMPNRPSCSLSPTPYPYTEWYFSGAPPLDCSTVAGQVIPAGTQVDTYPSTGAVCHNGCAVSLVLNGTSIGPPTGSNVYTGQSCPVSSTGTPGSLTPPSQTYNPDGTTTYCDTLSGKCVTFGGSPAAPASPSSTPNHSTDTTSNTTTSPTTTTTTTTTTNNSTTVITGDGSGGTGTGMGNGTATTSGSSTSTSTTDAPASSSSTSTKCTTGVCDVGNADGQIGGIYTGNPSTPGQAYQSFVAQVRTAPIMQAATSFFTVNASGSCPTWHFAGNPYWGPSGLDFTLFCDPAMLTLLQLAGLIVLATAAFSAFRIAIY